ncbi:hypothetical protein GGTG_12802 [Gaeumannomyces tritici R3-111a-1]|uniref:Uncharacterized protein n=1 Tax=Gaeumannomyces tritici (strain R3-111a-1) TaxID=644352 RepID=J3PH22_GAET3|nr:hypothetical protein GGTG_12802 [Gaeumannomyces tritici R3-111a-1]EJT69919.1 hypothetical protein GGTG_12802 [Gaeumannomyces tritici R3-111a-1]
MAQDCWHYDVLDGDYAAVVVANVGVIPSRARGPFAMMEAEIRCRFSTQTPTKGRFDPIAA